MTKKTKIKWRLSELPTASSLNELVNSGILDKEEAREILLNHETEEDRDKKSLESEIKFLRELVEKLSKNNVQIVETIRTVEKPYTRWEWYKPYEVWCGSLTTSGTGTMYLSNNSSDSISFSQI